MAVNKKWAMLYLLDKNFQKVRKADGFCAVLYEVKDWPIEKLNKALKPHYYEWKKWWFDET